MKPCASELQEWVYRAIVTQCRQRDVEPIFVYLETVTEPTEPWRAEQRAEVLQLARKAGFTIADFTGVYAPYKPSDLLVLKNDGHANVLGNRLIRYRLHDLLRRGDSMALATVR